MLKVEINDIDFFVQTGVSILEACEFVGIYVPRFCYYQNLSVAGNCRMCLVEIANSPKPVASCALHILNNMKIYVNSPLAKKARENVLEALLLNHPLDCPICDQGGECDLQDQSRAYGGDRTRFFFNKRVVEDKYCNPLIKTIMTRCIHCTRCVRFNAEISGNEFFGVLTRGTHTEIGSYGVSSYNSEISANIVDLCPVGALTPKQYSFKGRPWELRNFESIDLSDGLGSNIYVSIKESEILRVFPKLNYEINGNIISDKARFYYDYNKNNRLDKFFGFKNKIQNFKNLNLNDKKILSLLNNSIDTDTLFYFKNISNTKSNFKNMDVKASSFNFYINWLINPITNVMDLEIKNCFLLSSNIRLENSIINAKIRIKQVQNDLQVFGFSSFFNANFNLEFINSNLLKLFTILESKNASISNFLLISNPLIIFGENLLRRSIDFFFLLYFIKKICINAVFIKINVLSNSEAGNFFNFSKLNTRIIDNSDSIFFFHSDESFLTKKILKKNRKNFWLNSHDSNFLSKNENNFFLPCTTEYEQEDIFVNLEGRAQKTSKIFSPINKEILPIRNILNSDFNLNYLMVGYKRFLNFFKPLIRNSNLFKNLQTKKRYNSFILKEFVNLSKINISLYPIKTEVEDFYLSSKFLKKSKIMQICSQFKRKNSNNFTS